MPDVISDTNGKLCVASYHMWRLYPTQITTRLACVAQPREVNVNGASVYNCTCRVVEYRASENVTPGLELYESKCRS